LVKLKVSVVIPCCRCTPCQLTSLDHCQILRVVAGGLHTVALSAACQVTSVLYIAPSPHTELSCIETAVQPLTVSDRVVAGSRQWFSSF